MSTVFASRWKAAMWAVGVMFSAYCALPAIEAVKDDPPGAAANADSDASGGNSPWAIKSAQGH